MIKRRNYKVIALTLTFLMLFASVASAAIPTDSVIIGDKAYSIGYVTNPANAAEIQAALDNLGTGQLAYNIDGQTSGWTSIMEGTPLTADQITALPPITYKNDAGEVSNYAAGDGDLIPSGLAVSNVVADNGNITITVTGEGTPVEGDFTFVSRIGDAAKADLAVSNFNWTEATKTVTFTFAPFAATDTAQSIEIGWQYKDSKGWAAAFTVPAAEGLAVSSVSAINIKTIGVTFNNEPTAEQKTGLSFTVKNSAGATVATQVTWDGKIAKIARTNNIDYMAGTYTVEVAGLTAPYSANVEIAARKATSLEIGATQLPDATAAAPLNVTLKDQYGETMPLVQSDFTDTLYNETQGTVLTNRIGFASNNFNVNTAANADDFKLNDQVKVTFVHNATGLSATKTIPVVAGAQVAEITLGEVVLPTGAKQLTQNLTNVRIPVTAKDQYGNAITLTKDANVSLFSSDQGKILNGSLTFVAVDRQQYINIASFVAKGNVTVQLLGIGSGVTASKALTILDAPGAIDTVTPAETQLTVAAGSTVNLALTVKDLYGTDITPANYIGKITATSTNTSVVAANPALVASGPNHGKLAITVLPGATPGASTTITLLVGGVAKATVTVTAGAAAVPSSIEVKTTPTPPTTTLLVGGTTTIDYVVRDQYGSVMSGTLTGYQITYDTTVTNDNSIIQPSNRNAVTALNSASKTITAIAQGTMGFRASLVRTADSVTVDSVTTNFTVNPLSGLTYSIDDIPALYKKAGATDANSCTAALVRGYAKEIVVKANDGTPVPFNSIVSVQSNNADVVVFNDGSKWYVTTKNVTIPTPAADVKATLTVLVNAQDTLHTLTKEVTVSKDDLQVASVEFKNKKPLVASLRDSGLADVTTLTLANKAAYNGKLFANDTLYVWVRDQFGGFGLSYASGAADPWTTGAPTLALAPVTGVEGIASDVVKLVTVGGDASQGTVGIQEGSLTLTTNNNADWKTNNAQFRIIASLGGKSDFITATMVDGIDPAFAATYPKAGAAQAAGSKDVQILVQSNEAGKAYMVLVNDGAGAPSAVQVKAGKDSSDSDVAATAKGVVNLTANAEANLILKGAADATDYDVYVVVEDAAGNLSAPVKVDVATPAGS